MVVRLRERRERELHESDAAGPSALAVVGTDDLRRVARAPRPGQAGAVLTDDGGVARPDQGPPLLGRGRRRLITEQSAHTSSIAVTVSSTVPCSVVVIMVPPAARTVATRSAARRRSAGLPAPPQLRWEVCHRGPLR